MSAASSGSQDVIIVGSRERLAIDALPVRLAVACAVVIDDGLGGQARADPHRCGARVFTQDFGQDAAAGKLPPRGVHPEREYGNVADQEQG